MTTINEEIAWQAWKSCIKANVGYDETPEKLEAKYDWDVIREKEFEPWYKGAMQVIRECSADEHGIEKETENNMNLIGLFLEHVKSEGGINVPEDLVMSFFNA